MGCVYRFCRVCGSGAIWPVLYSGLEYPLDADWSAEAMEGQWECECGHIGEPDADVLDPSVPYYKLA